MAGSGSGSGLGISKWRDRDRDRDWPMAVGIGIGIRSYLSLDRYSENYSPTNTQKQWYKILNSAAGEHFDFTTMKVVQNCLPNDRKQIKFCQILISSSPERVDPNVDFRDRDRD